MKSKLLIIILLLLLISSNFAVLDQTSREIFQHQGNQDQDQNISYNTDQISTDTVQESSPEPTNQNVENVEYNTWYEGQTVKVIENYRTSFPKLTEMTNEIIGGSSDWSCNNQLYTNIFSDNNYNFTNSCGGSSTSSISYNYLYLNIFAGHKGVLTFETYSDVTTDAGTYSTNVLSGTFDTGNECIGDPLIGNCDNKYLDREGNIKILIVAHYISANINIQIFIIANDGDLNELDTVGPVSAPSSTVSNIAINIDVMKYDANTITNNYRTEYKYKSETQIVHRLILEATDYNILFYIYNPLNWNMTSVTPFVNWGWNTTGEHYDVNAERKGTYEIYFISGASWGVDYPRESSILAINDHSSDYTQNLGFEDGTTSHFDYVSDSSTISSNTSTVFSGSFSARSSSSTSEYYGYSDDYLASGGYYFALNYYVETAPTSLDLIWRDDQANSSHSLDVSVTDRWVSDFVYIHYEDDSIFDFSIIFNVAASSEYVIFFDLDKPLWQSNARFENYKYNHGKINYQLVYPDNLQFARASNVYSNVTIGDRTVQTDILTKECYTDNSGYCEVDYKASLEIKEHYLNVSSTTNHTTTYFTPLPASTDSYSYQTNGIQNDIPNYWDFSEGTDEGYDSVSEGIVSISNGQLVWEINATSIGKFIQYRDDANYFDLEYYQNTMIRITSNASVDIDLFYRDFGGSNPDYDLSQLSLSAGSQILEFDNTEDLAKLLEYDTIYFRFFTANVATKLEIDYIYLVHEDDISNDLNVDSTTGLGYFDDSDTSNSSIYYTELNGSQYGYFEDGELFYLPMEEGFSYNFTYTTISSTRSSNFVQTPSTFYEYSYSVEIDFVISNFNFYLSDSDEFLTFHSSKSGTVTIYHNDTNVDSASINQGYNTISSSRDLTPGAIIFYAALFTDGDGNSGWYNTTISNQDPVTDVTRVHFQFVNLAGVGINFDIARLYINDTRQYNNEYSYEEGTFLNISVRTHFNTTVVQTNTTVSGDSDQDVVIIVPLYLQYFNNLNKVPIAVNITSTDYDISFIIGRNESFSMWVISAEYDITIDPLQDIPDNSTHTLSYKSKTEFGVNLPTSDQRISFSLDLVAEKIDTDDPVENKVESFFGPELSKFILNFIFIFLTIFSIGIAIILYKVLEATGQSGVVSFYNLTWGALTGNRMRYRRNIIISKDEPTYKDEYSAGFADYTRADENIRFSATSDNFTIKSVLNITFAVIAGLVFIALVGIIILTQFESIISTVGGQ